MATTTNYSWTTPDDTDLVKDGAAAIRTLGSSADTTVKALNPGTTAGDVDYYTTSTAKARVAIGTAGQVLTVNAGATAPEWATPDASLTFENVGDTSERTTTSTSFVALGTSSAVTITTGTKALVLFGGQVRYQPGAITFDITGATTDTGGDQRAVILNQTELQQVSRHFLITGLTAGSNTFTLKYRSLSGSSTQFTRTNLTVIDMGS